MKKILHLVNDEKFIAFAHQSFDAFPSVVNDFWVLTQAASLKHIAFPCERIALHRFYTPEFQKKVDEYDLIVIHFLDAKYDALLKNAALKPKILWIGWGGDYYWLVDTLSDFHMFKPKTREWVSGFLGSRLLYPVLKKINKIRRKKRLKLINKSISYFAPVLPNDYDLIIKSHPDFKPVYRQWNYGNLEQDYIKGYENFVVSDFNILLGNSATPTNNHLDVLDVLKEIDFKAKKIVVPLSYGNKEYGKAIAAQAVTILDDNAMILSDFMAYEDYMKILQGCGNVIMGHVRQQALGNIVAMLYVGAKLFFYSDSVTYLFFKERGFSVFTLDDLKANPELLELQLDQQTILAHREKLMKVWSKAQNYSNTETVINTIQCEK